METPNDAQSNPLRPPAEFGSADTSDAPGTATDVTFPWTVELELWSYDFDYLGHLTAAIYPKAFEEARVRLLQRIWGVEMPEYVVAWHEMEYRKEIRQSAAPIRVVITPTRVGTTSFNLEEQLLDKNGTTCNISQVTLVAWDRSERRPRKLTQTERAPLDRGIPRSP